MSTPRLPNQKTQYKKLNERLSKYMASVLSIYESLNKEAAKIALSTDYDGTEEFSFDDYPITKDRVQKLQQQFVSDLGGVIMSGTSEEWKNSNLLQDMIADKVLGKYVGEHKGKEFEHYYQKNSGALKAFQQRKDKGLNLSQKLWNQSADYKTELEEILSVSIEKGIDAVTLSKRVSKYLWDFPSMQAAYEEKFGHASRAKNCEYRSIRLARSEINMAYRTAEQERWRQFDFVVGYEIKLSGSHPAEDVCDRLAGKYPKDFVWTGWHPNDLCYVVPILKTDEEYFADDDIKSKNEVTDVPREFKDWCTENWNRISKAEKRGTLPYFLRDNKEYYQKELSVKKAAVLRHKNRDAKAIQAAWDNRKLLNVIYDTDISNMRKISKTIGVDVSAMEDYIKTAKVKTDANGIDEKFEVILNEIQAQKKLNIENLNKRFTPLRELRGQLNVAVGDYRFDDIIREIDEFINANDAERNMLEKGAKYVPISDSAIKDFLKDKKSIIDKRRGILHSVNEEMISDALGVKKGKPMSFIEADELKGNPNYKSELKGYSNNCPACVIANELRRSGWDVEALPRIDDEDGFYRALARNTKMVWVNPKTGRAPVTEFVSLKGKNEEQMLAAIESKIKSKGRYHVRLEWDETYDSDYGHIFVVEKKRNGTIFAHDPQTGDGESGGKLLNEYLMMASKAQDVQIYRVDDCDLVVDILKKIVKAK